MPKGVKAMVEPRLGIDVVELGGDDEAVHQGGALASATGAGDQPGFAAECESPRSAALLVRQSRPSSRKSVNEGQRFSI